MNISSWSIRHPIPPIILFLLLSVAGVFSYFTLAIEENPNIDLPLVTVTVAQAGAAPAELETQVTRRVEDAVAGIGNVKHITSAVNEGASTTSIEFELGTDTDRAVNDVRDAVTRIRAQLPGQAQEPIIQRIDFVGGAMATYTVASSSLSLSELSWLIDNELSRDLLAIPGVGQVQRQGGVDREIRVELDPGRLEAVGLTVDQVNNQIRALNINLPGGRAGLGGQEETIRTLGSAPTVEELRGARIALPNHSWARLDTLGRVLDTSSEPRQNALLNGQEVVAFSVVRTSGSNIVEVQSQVDEVLRNFHPAIAPDLKIERVRTNARYVEESYHSSVEHLVLGAGLAVLVIWLFLMDWRAAGISAMAMPLSVIPTFFLMKLMGFTLNSMSLLGLSLVIGILVDDAIVEIENIVRHMHMGKSAYRASLEAADEIGLAVIATTFTIIVVFVPVAFMGGIPGQFFRQFGLVVAAAVFFSLVVARLITPLMAAYWLKTSKAPRSPEQSRLIRVYEPILHWALDNRGATIAMMLIFFLFSLALFAMLPKSLVSAADRGEIILSVELPPGTELSETTRVARQVSARLKKMPEIQLVFASIGTPASTGRVSSAGAVNSAALYIGLTPKEERERSQKELEEAIRADLSDIPGARMSFTAQGLGGRMQFVLTSENEQDLTRTSNALIEQMRGLPQIYDVLSGAALLRPEVRIIPDPVRAAEQGVSIQSVARTAQLATLGDIEQNLAKFDLPGRQINIRVQLAVPARESLEQLRNLKVATSTGALIPLSNVASIELGTGPSQINRYDRDRQVTISAALRGQFTLGDALAAVRNLPAYKNRPPTVHETPAGDAEIQRDVFGGFMGAMLAAVMLIYAVLTLLFGNFFHPFTIMIALPLSFGGAVIGLMVTNEPVGMFALIGIVMLMGLTTKNSILLVEYAIVAMNEGQGRVEALLSAGDARIRPILMTTVAMIAGMMPIALGIGAGAEVRRPMAIAVIGGLVSSTLLTLIVVPVVFTFVDDLRAWLSRLVHPHEVVTPTT